MILLLCPKSPICFVFLTHSYLQHSSGHLAVLFVVVVVDVLGGDGLGGGGVEARH